MRQLREQAGSSAQAINSPPPKGQRTYTVAPTDPVTSVSAYNLKYHEALHLPLSIVTTTIAVQYYRIGKIRVGSLYSHHTAVLG